MKDIYEISKSSIQSDWRGIIFKDVSIYYNAVPKCESCSEFKISGSKEQRTNTFTLVVFTFYNSNSFPIYTDFVDKIVAIDSNNEQIDPIDYEFICKQLFEFKLYIHNNNSIMPKSVQKRFVMYSNSFSPQNPIVRLDYRGCIYSKYESCNWGYFSYNIETKELLTNGSLNYIQRINEEYEIRKRDKLYEKSRKLMSELEVFLYKRNELPVTYKEFTALTIKIQGHIKELTELNKRDKLELDSHIEQYKISVEKPFTEDLPVFIKTDSFKILPPEQNITPEDFEHYVAAHFLKNGYKAEVTRYLLDGGIDIVLAKDEKLYGVQCKYLSPKRCVDTVDMLHFLGALVNMRADGGFFVTTGKITSAGQDIAKRNGITIITVC